MKQFNLSDWLRNPARGLITRDGRPARIICTDRLNPDVLNFNIVALIEEPSLPHFESIQTYTNDGFAKSPYGETEDDLFFVPEMVSRWVSLYRGESGEIHTSPAARTKEDGEQFMKQYGGFGLTEITWLED